MIERKCTNCGQWNKNERYCINCGEPMWYEDIRKRDVERLKAENPEKETAFDRFLKKTKNHRFLVVRMAYYIAFSISMFIGGLGVFASLVSSSFKRMSSAFVHMDDPS